MIRSGLCQITKTRDAPLSWRTDRGTYVNDDNAQYDMKHHTDHNNYEELNGLSSDVLTTGLFAVYKYSLPNICGLELANVRWEFFLNAAH